MAIARASKGGTALPIRAQTLADAAFALAERLGEAQTAAHAWFRQGSIGMSQDDTARAVPLLVDALTRFEAVRNVEGANVCLTDLGIHAFNQGDVAEAVIYFERARAIADTHQGPFQRGTALGNLALASYCLGHFERAQQLNAETLAPAERIGNAYVKAGALALDGWLAFARGEITRAAALSGEAIVLHWEFGDKWLLAPELEMAAAVMAAGNRAVEATRLFGAVEVLRAAISSPRGRLEQPGYEQNLATARAALDEAAFAHAWEEGRRWSRSSAVTDAREVLAAIAGETHSGSTGTAG